MSDSERSTRIDGHVPLVDADTTDARIDDGATLLVSGFGSVGYPKNATSLALSNSRAKVKTGCSNR